MRDEPFTGEPDPFDVTVTPSIPARSGDAWVMSATLENGADSDGGEVELRISDTARSAHGLGACIDEFEHWLNSTLRPEYRLGAAIAMAAQGAFTVVAAPGMRPRVLAPPAPGATGLAA